MALNISSGVYNASNTLRRGDDRSRLIRATEEGDWLCHQVVTDCNSALVRARGQ
jgi:hypothetical protein